eukprot:TRINITY_DN21498_c0_g1_i2.p1 TRINITY_DN21498_c0_g1~~TRINITY_DN21498_c0_g1_i2.p1  ORF type:complete len:809 (+),score=180.05 TRINITY_DN21498_c0_g1_i2:117-2543(+)
MPIAVPVLQQPVPDPDQLTTTTDTCFITALRPPLATPLPSAARLSRPGSAQLSRVSTAPAGACIWGRAGARGGARIDTPSTRRNDGCLRLGLPQGKDQTHLARLTTQLNRRAGAMHRPPRPSGSAPPRPGLPLVEAEKPAGRRAAAICDDIQKGIHEWHKLHSCQELPEHLASGALAASRTAHPRAATAGPRRGVRSPAASGCVLDASQERSPPASPVAAPLLQGAAQDKRPQTGARGSPSPRPGTDRQRPRTAAADTRPAAVQAPASSPSVGASSEPSPRRRLPHDLVDRNIAQCALEWRIARRPSTLRRKGALRDTRIEGSLCRRAADEGSWVAGLQERLERRDARFESERKAAAASRQLRRAAGFAVAQVLGECTECWAAELMKQRNVRRRNRQRELATGTIARLLGPRVRLWKTTRVARQVSLAVMATLRRGMMRNAIARRGRASAMIQDVLYLIKFQLRVRRAMTRLRTDIILIQRWWRAYRRSWEAQMRVMRLQWAQEERVQEKKFFKEQVDDLRTLTLLKELALIVDAVQRREHSDNRCVRQLLASERLCSRDKVKQQAQRLTTDDLRRVAGARNLSVSSMRTALAILAEPNKQDCFSELKALKVNEISDERVAAAAKAAGAWHPYTLPSEKPAEREMVQVLHQRRAEHAKALAEHRRQVEARLQWRAQQQRRVSTQLQRAQQFTTRRQMFGPFRPILHVIQQPHVREVMFLRALAATYAERGETEEAAQAQAQADAIDKVSDELEHRRRETLRRKRLLKAIATAGCISKCKPSANGSQRQTSSQCSPGSPKASSPRSRAR